MYIVYKVSTKKCPFFWKMHILAMERRHRSLLNESSGNSPRLGDFTLPEYFCKVRCCDWIKCKSFCKRTSSLPVNQLHEKSIMFVITSPKRRVVFTLSSCTLDRFYLQNLREVRSAAVSLKTLTILFYVFAFSYSSGEELQNTLRTLHMPTRSVTMAG